MEDIIVPYTRDDDHNAPRFVLVQVYPQIHLPVGYGHKNKSVHEENVDESDAK